MPRPTRSSRRPAPGVLLPTGLALLLVSACVGPLGREPLRVQPPEAALGSWAEERRGQFEEAVRAYQAYDARLRPIADRLQVSSPELCGSAGVGRRMGVGLLARSDVERWAHLPELRALMLEVAADVLGVGEGVTVITVVPELRADQAGLRPRDRALRVGGRPVDSVRRFYDAIRSAGETEVVVELERPGASFQMTVPFEPACDVPVFLVVNQTPAIFFHGRGVTLSSGTMDFTESDDELAFVLAVQMAHTMLGHRMRERVRRQPEADYLAVYLATRAGYDPGNAISILERWSLRAPMALQSEPGPLEGTPGRIELISNTLEEIEAKRAAGAPILPRLTP